MVVYKLHNHQGVNMLPSIDEINQWIKNPLLKIAASPLLSLLSLLSPSVRKFLNENILPALTQKTLLISALIFAYLFFVALLAICALRKEIKELHSFTSDFGIYWDKNKKPYCPKCKIPLSGYTEEPQPVFYCHGHDKLVYIHDVKGVPITQTDAQSRLQKHRV